MTLTKQNAVVPFVGGLQTKQNEFLVQPPNMLELDNGVFRLEGEIAKRFGFTELGFKDFNDNEISGKKLLTYNNDLVQLSQSRLYSYAENANIWFDKGAFASVTATKASVVRNRASQINQCNATHQGVTVVGWKDSRASNLLKYAIIDEETQTVIKPDATLSTNGGWVVASRFLTAFLVLLYNEGAVLKCKIIDTTSFQEFDQTITGVGIGTALTASLLEVGTRLALLHNNAGDDAEISILFLDPQPLSITIPSIIKNGGVGGVFAPATTMDCCHLFKKPEANQIFAVYASGTAVRMQGMFQSFIINNAHNVPVATASAAVPRVSGTVDPATGQIVAVWETSAASSKNHSISTQHFTYDSLNAPVLAGSTATVKRSVGLVAHCFTFNSAVYFVTAHESSLQSTVFLLEYKSQTEVPIAGKFLTYFSGGHPASGQMPSVETGLDSKQIISLLEITKLNSDTGTINDNTGVVKIKLDFQNPPFVGAQLGQSLLLAGGFIAAYEGAEVVEHSFHVFPEDVSVDEAVGGTSMVLGTYSVQVIYEWSDAKGQIYRSAPSITELQEITVLNNKLVVTVPTLRLSSKRDVSIVVYVSAANGTILYRADTTPNNPAVDSVDVEILDTSAITSQEIIYTTGNVVENIAPPAASIVQRHKNRIFLAGLENENELRYSQESILNEGLGFSDSYILRVNPSGGPITALGTLDDKLIIFKQNSIYALTGEGPVLTGQGGDYRQPEEIASDVGCNNPSSIVTTPLGLMFSSDKGIRLLNRSLQIEDIGAPVEKYETLSVSSAVIVPTYDEARFTTTSGVALIYNYAFQLWSVFTNYQANSAVSWLGNYLHLTDDGRVQKEVEGSYNDNDKPIPLHLKTSWIALAGLQGYKRIYRILMLGKKLSEHAFRVNIRYDYDEVIRETVYFNTLTAMNQETVPQNMNWVGIDSAPINGVKSNVFQFEIAPRIQKCESIQLEIEDVPLNGHISASYTLSGLTFLLGVIDGTAQVVNTIGSKK